jgi:2-succinyl-5-enolpyruvyl-6-hydroxy-3-cyclohexene-1-carboxylate synthase
VSTQNLLTEWARLLINSLVDAGIGQAVISPGSRSTPFAWAALKCPRLCSRVIVDERSAGYFAVAQGKMSGRASLLVCTSGSAAANYYPSIIEASESQTPLLVLTADRPLELQARAAPQTIDQIKLYGDYVRRYVELGLPEPEPSSLRALRSTAFAAELTTRAPRPGPVHLNARARKPLGPLAATGPDAEALASTVDRILEEPLETTRSWCTVPDAASLALVCDACEQARAGVIVCGSESAATSLDPATVAAFARVSGFAVLREATSQLRFCGDAALGKLSCDAVEPLLESGPVPPEPYVILQLGRPPTSSSYHAHLLRHAHAAVYVVAPSGWPDPTSRARMMLNGDPHTIVECLTRELQTRAASVPSALLRERLAYRAELRAADERAWLAIHALLGGPEPVLSEGRAIRMTVDNVPMGSVLALGNSLPVREVDMYCPGTRGVLKVLSQRGTNGIDGLISGAAGAASVTRQPTTLIVGDVSLLHDLGGLWCARSLGMPLVVVVINNGGGRIFDTLAGNETPAGTTPELEVWTTPPRIDLSHAARTFGARYFAAQTPRELQAVLQRAYIDPDLCLVEVLVDPSSVLCEHQRYRAELSRTLSAVQPPSQSLSR